MEIERNLLGDAPRASAEFHGKNRLTLSREWGSGSIACVIGCNPSTADAFQDERNVR